MSSVFDLLCEKCECIPCACVASDETEEFDFNFNFRRTEAGFTQDVEEMKAPDDVLIKEATDNFSETTFGMNSHLSYIVFLEEIGMGTRMPKDDFLNMASNGCMEIKIKHVKRCELVVIS